MNGYKQTVRHLQAEQNVEQQATVVPAQKLQGKILTRPECPWRVHRRVGRHRADLDQLLKGLNQTAGRRK